MFAIDTNLLVYAHNEDSQFHHDAVTFLERVMNERDEDGNLTICIPTQVFTEFIHVITRQAIQKPLSLQEAIDVVQEFLDAEIQVVSHQSTQIQTFLDLLRTVTTRKKTFDVALAATLKDNEIEGLYTVNVADFEDFDGLTVINPLKKETGVSP
ncbi:MAG: PIN domain-containing protein [bacterium]|nr:PIN domain-containing protein [bacterium]